MSPRSVILNFDALQDLWDWSLKTCTKLRIKSAYFGDKSSHKEFAYIFGLRLAETILAHTNNLNKTLKGTKKTAVDAQVAARVQQ